MRVFVSILIGMVATAALAVAGTLPDGGKGHAILSISQSTRPGGDSSGERRRVIQFGGPKEFLPSHHSLPQLLSWNGRVRDFMNYLLKNRFRFLSEALARSGRYLPMMKEVFGQTGLPDDLVYLCLIESGFRTDARSDAMAVGPWQFIQSTANLYGLVTTRWIDERMDPVKSTRAAAAYLKELHRRFGQWPLAVAGYHAGDVKVRRALFHSKTDNFWDLAETAHLQEATKDYVPKFIAATMIARAPRVFGLRNIRYESPMEFDTVRLDQAVDLSEIGRLGRIQVAQIRELNPALLQDSTPPDYPGFRLRVPKGTGKAIQSKLAAETVGQSARGNSQAMFYVVRKGDTLFGIARKHGIKLGALRSLNGLKEDQVLFPGDRLRLRAETVQREDLAMKRIDKK